MPVRIITLLLLLGLAGCGSSGSRDDRYGRADSGVTVYVVQRGDTLYSIAFRYGLDYRKVAEVNSIRDPYTIYPGQNIYLWQVGSPSIPAPVATAPPAVEPVVSAPTSATPSPVIVTAVPGIAAPPPRVVPMSPGPVYQDGPAITAGDAPPPAVAAAPAPAVAAAPAPVLAGSSIATPAAAPAPVPAPGPAPAPPATAAPAPAAAPAPGPARAPKPGGKVTSWRWPAAGPVTRGYSSSVHKGIDIGGNRGDPVYAVADGTVVYAGTGIVGFGELVIVKHNEIYISAYGHNNRLLVRENDVVGAGQQIAEKGSSGTDTVKLHFEIRREGKPVDPLKLLPSR